MSTNTGSWIAIAGLVVGALAYFGIVVEENSVIQIITGLVALYGVIHQIVITNKVVKMAKQAGVQGLK